MKFNFSSTQSINRGNLLYIEEDYSFIFSPSPKSCITSVVIDTLELMIDRIGYVLEVRGYCPYFDWKKTNISPPNYIQGSLIVELDEIIPGVSERLAGYGEWNIFVNPKNGWLCVGEDKYSSASVAVEFASSSVAVLEKELLKAIWLHPASLPKAIGED